MAVQTPKDVPPLTAGERRILHEKIASIDAIKAEILALTQDPEVVRDSLEGAVDFEAIFDFLLRDIRHNDALIDALKEEALLVKARADRLRERTERARQLLRKTLDTAKMPACERPLATLTIAKRAPSLGELDESKIHSKFWKDQPMVLDRTALLEALKAGEKVAGAQLAPPGTTLKISMR